ncbi:MAG: hypothetical protein ACJ76Y_13550 [Thermoanaerobaculia bacterium]
MRKNAARILGLLVTVLALSTPAHRAEAQKACTLLCIQGYHCCVHGSNQTCVPDSQPC